MKEQLLLLGDEYTKPKKNLDLSTSTLEHFSPLRGTKDRLRIDTYPRTALYDRYLSDEEEPSPSPEDSPNEEAEDNAVVTENIDDEIEYAAIFACKAEIAVAVPIMSVGRPKLVDITNIAPMQKRKRPTQHKQSYSTFLPTGTRLTPIANENDIPCELGSAKSVYSADSGEIKSMVFTAPESWLPEQPSQEEVEEDDFAAYSGVMSASTYEEHDPYNLEPPRLRSSPPRKRTMRRYNHPPSSMKHSSAWRGLTRSLSLAKKQESQNAQPRRTKKAKFLARGAQEIEPMMIIPPFPFETKASA